MPWADGPDSNDTNDLTICSVKEHNSDINGSWIVRYINRKTRQRSNANTPEGFESNIWGQTYDGCKVERSTCDWILSRETKHHRYKSHPHTPSNSHWPGTRKIGKHYISSLESGSLTQDTSDTYIENRPKEKGPLMNFLFQITENKIGSPATRPEDSVSCLRF